MPLFAPAATSANSNPAKKAALTTTTTATVDAAYPPSNGGEERREGSAASSSKISSRPTAATTASSSTMTAATAATAALSVDAAGPSSSSSPEEGQEALWIEVEPSPSPVNNASNGRQPLSSTNHRKAETGGAKNGGGGPANKDSGGGGNAGGAAPAPRMASFRFPSPLRAHRQHAKDNKPNNKSGKASTSHVLLMDPQHTVVTTRLGQARETPHDIQRAAIHKANQARQLLRQASSSAQNDSRRRTEWAQSAFATALEARLLIEPSVTDDLQVLLQSVCQAGIEAAARPKGMGESYACLGQIIDCVGSATTTAPGTVMMDGEHRRGGGGGDSARMEADDISTLGFDNTFEAPPTPRGAAQDDDDARAAARAAAAANAAEVLSVTSLNEILDAPMDNTNNDAAAAAAMVTAAPAALPDSTTRKEAKSRPPLFGGVAKKKRSGVPSGAGQGGADAAAPKAKPKGRWRRMSKSKTRAASAKPTGAGDAATDDADGGGGRRAGRFVQRFSATVVAEDDSDPEDDALRPTADELRAHEVDLRLHAKLQEALQNDGSESVISLHGVPLHGMDVTKKNKKKSKEHKASDSANKNKEAQTTKSPADAPVPPSRVKPQMFDKVKPKFTAAPRGEAHILMQKSWESLEEVGALDGAPVLRMDVPPPPPPPPPPAKGRGGTTSVSKLDNVEIDPLVVPLPSKSPASSTASSPSRGKAEDEAIAVEDRKVSSRRGDKYLVEPTAEVRADRYAPADENELAADSFEDREDKASCPPFLQSCMDVVRPPRPAQETVGEADEPAAIEAMAEAERYVPVDFVGEEMETPVVLETAEKAPPLPVKKSSKWKLPLFGRGARKQMTSVVVPPLPSEDVSTGSRPVSKGPSHVAAPPKRSSATKQPSAKPRNRGRTTHRGEASRPTPIVSRQSQPAQASAPTTPQQYATVVSPPPLPNMTRPFATFRSARPASALDPTTVDKAVPAFNVKSPGAETTTAVEQLVRTFSKQGSVTVAQTTSTTTAATTAGVSVAAVPTSVRQWEAPNRSDRNVLAPFVGPTSKPTSPSFFGTRLGPFGRKNSSNSRKSKGATTVAIGGSRPPPAPTPAAPEAVAVATTESTAASIVSSLAATGTADSVVNVQPPTPTKTDTKVAQDDYVDHREKELSEGDTGISPTYTTAEDSAATEDSLVHLIKEQQKRDKRNRPPKKPLSPTTDRHRRGRLRGLEPMDRDSAMATASHSSSRGIDP